MIWLKCRELYVDKIRTSLYPMISLTKGRTFGTDEIQQLTNRPQNP